MFTIFHDAGEEDLHRGLLVRGMLAFEAAQVALGHRLTLEFMQAHHQLSNYLYSNLMTCPKSCQRCDEYTLCDCAPRFEWARGRHCSYAWKEVCIRAQNNSHLSDGACWEALVDILAGQGSHITKERHPCIVQCPDRSWARLRATLALAKRTESAGLDKTLVNLQQLVASSNGNANSVADISSVMDSAQLHEHHKEQLRIQIEILENAGGRCAKFRFYVSMCWTSGPLE